MYCLNPFGTGQCLSTLNLLRDANLGLNPFGTGQCLSTLSFMDGNGKWMVVSIPLEQGSVFRLMGLCKVLRDLIRLNPFGTGQCLSTAQGLKSCVIARSQSLWNRAVSFDNKSICSLNNKKVSIPLEQGSVFRQHRL